MGLTLVLALAFGLEAMRIGEVVAAGCAVGSEVTAIVKEGRPFLLTFTSESETKEGGLSLLETLPGRSTLALAMSVTLALVSALLERG